MARRQRSRKVDPRISTFVACVRQLITPWLATFGFSREKSELERWLAAVPFTNGARYVRFSASSDPRDGISSSEVVLGEGKRSWPEVDWNGVALRRLAKAQGASDVSEYPLEEEALMSELVERQRADLDRYAAGFLRGDLAVFQRVRAENNRAREPYAIHTCHRDGTFTTEIDAASAELKARFS